MEGSGCGVSEGGVTLEVGEDAFYNSGQSPNRHLTELVAAHFFEYQNVYGNEDLSFLDCCCSTGIRGLRLAKRLSSRVSHVSFLDYDPAMISLARTNASAPKNSFMREGIKTHFHCEECGDFLC